MTTFRDNIGNHDAGYAGVNLENLCSIVVTCGADTPAVVLLILGTIAIDSFAKGSTDTDYVGRYIADTKNMGEFEEVEMCNMQLKM